MAEILSNHTFTKAGRRDVYPWDEWLDGNARRLIHGVDFHGTIGGFRTTASQAALRRGIRVQTQQDGDDIIVQAFTLHEPPRPQSAT